MRVVVTADTLGGVWIYARELVTELLRRGNEVVLVSFGDIPNAAQMEWMEGLKGLDFRPTAFKLEWMQDSEEDLEASSDYLLNIIEEVKPDLLHLNQFYYGSLKCDVPRIVVAHSDIVSWWMAVHGSEPRESKWTNWYRESVARGLSHANAVVAPTQTMLENVVRYYGKPSLGVVIYNGRNPNLFSSHLSKEVAVLSVGRLWDAGKNVALLTQIEPALPIYIVGSERHPDMGENSKISAAGWERIHMKGPQSEGQLRQLYARTAIYAATSRYEPFGLAPLEAALSRCAIVANDIPSFHELWGEAACYFRHNDPESLRENLSRLSRDRELCSRYAGLAQARARQRFTSERMVEDYLNVYQILTPAEAMSI